MTPPEYKRHAYARSIYYELARHLKDRFAPDIGPPKAEIICEEVFYADRVVPRDVLQDMVLLLNRLEEREREKMSDFVTERRKQDEPLPPQEVPREKTREKRKRKDATQ